jgi:Flp pilus assembly protein TadG
VRGFSGLRRFATARDGLAAIEFALLLPLMMVLYFGALETTELVSAYRRTENVSASMADIVARSSGMDSAQLADLQYAINQLIYPSDPSIVAVRVSSISIPKATTTKLEWSKCFNMAGNACSAAGPSVPTSLMVVGTSLIRSEVSMSYVPPTNVFFHKTFALSRVEYRRPRRVDPVPCTGCS